ncbi:MAG: queuosine salvage family protein [Myxococcota bacterium]
MSIGRRDSAPSLFDEIRAAAAEVTRRARDVRIDEERLDAFADGLAAAPIAYEDLDPMHDFVGELERALAFTIALDAINFGSGWFPVLRKRAGLSGYRSIATACRESVLAGDPWDGAWLRAATPDSMARLLGQALGDPEVAELMTLYAQAWRELGEWLERRHGDRFDAVVASAGRSAERLVRMLAELPLYRDVARYDELDVPFYKRAQITAADLARVFAGEGPGAFDDLDALTLFADNLVPHVLRCHGVLAYSDALAARIEAETLLAVGSRPEVEIRAVALEAVERLVRGLAARGCRTTAHALDGRLWNAGQAAWIKARPRHRARCPYY